MADIAAAATAPEPAPAPEPEPKTEPETEPATVNLRCNISVAFEGQLESGEMTEHQKDLPDMTSAADVREALRNHIHFNVPEHDKHRVVSLTCGPKLDKDLEDIDDIRDLGKPPLQPEGGLLRVKATLGLKSGLLMSADMTEHDEGKELVDHDIGDDHYKLTVHVACGKDLRGMSKNGTSDPFVQCELCHDDETESGDYPVVDFLSRAGGKKVPSKKRRQALFRKRTSVRKRNNINPRWDEDLSFDIPGADVSPEELNKCVLRIHCFSANSTVGKLRKRSTGDHLIGSTTIKMLDVLETISDAENAVNDNVNEMGGSDWYYIMDKKKAKTKPTDVEDPAEEEQTGKLQLSFSLVEPKGIKDETPAATAPELEPEPEPELELELETPRPRRPQGHDQDGTPFANPEPPLQPEDELELKTLGTLEVEVLRCTQILAPHDKKRSAKVYVEMSIGHHDGGAAVKTSCAQWKKNDPFHFELAYHRLAQNSVLSSRVKTMLIYLVIREKRQRIRGDQRGAPY
eukprot:COSAG02_NODE_1369_length_13028_cov_2.767345_1_plen_516_part_00